MMAPSRSAVGRLVVVLAFIGACLAVIGYMWTATGAKLPWSDRVGYQVGMDVADVDNLVPNTDVRIAGVEVGKVQHVTPQGRSAHVVLSVYPSAAPVHEGATVRIGAKSVVGESYIDVKDGAGRPIPSGTTLPGAAVQPNVQLNDVLASLDPKTREALSGSIRSVGDATAGSRGSVQQTLTGLGNLGREGHTVIDAVAAQSEDLKALTADATTVLNALDSGNGRIATLVDNAQRLTGATAGERGDIVAAMRKLPPTMTAARGATTKVTDLSHSLAPVAADLRQAAPELGAALREMPATTRDLRGSLPALGAALQEAPPTLQGIPTVGQDLRGLIPTARGTLADVNPMLSYIRPYGGDIGAFFANFNAALVPTAENGKHALRLLPNLSDRTVKGLPVPLSLGQQNPYPAAGSMGNPAPFNGPYPRVERQPR